ncbi:MAG: hypothetical protein U0905_04510 [Pirellulales bacterium]
MSTRLASCMLGVAHRVVVFDGSGIPDFSAPALEYCLAHCTPALE